MRCRAFAPVGVLAVLAFAANAAGPSRGGSLTSRPSIGVFPGAPAAIAPSFRSTPPRARVHGYRPLSRAAVPVFVGPPAFYEPAYAEPPVAYVPPIAPSLPPAAPPPERDVVQHSEGRYELRGDGIAAPHRWVWIPNPPPPPPSTGRNVRLYGWVDEEGAIHVTDRLDRVPERHRAQAKRNASS